MQRTLSLVAGMVRVAATAAAPLPSQTAQLFVFLRAGTPAAVLPVHQTAVRFAKKEAKGAASAAPQKKQAKISKTGKGGPEKKDEFDDGEDEAALAKTALDARNLTRVEDISEEDLKNSLKTVTGLKQARCTLLCGTITWWPIILPLG